MTGIKLNLGCGMHPMPGFVNVDKYGDPDVKHDLTVFPWPWAANSVDQIVMHHVLEHLGETTEVYFNIIKELYRICQGGARIFITVPHPRHDDFMHDPTHVRPITENGLALFSKASNRQWARENRSNSPLGLFLDVDFMVINATYILTHGWQAKLDRQECTQEEVYSAIDRFNNVVKEIEIVLEVVKG
ncbi:MAG: hypothetical protein H7839_11155 [Magnetococcus sp. YQC-5]